MDIILKGIGAGFALALLIGPVFFTLLQTSVERGFRSGTWVAVGVSLSDSLYILICYLGLSTALANDRAQQYIGYAGGMILFCFGLYYLFIKSRRPLDFRSVNIPSSGPVKLIIKGFIINGLSPMVLIFWLGMVSVATGEFGYTSLEALIFFGSVVATVFATDLLKAKTADKLRQVMTVHLVRLLNIVLGSGMILFAMRMLFIARSFSES
jgi:threonine/homoserine/homoserine lactone efflux protein